MSLWLWLGAALVLAFVLDEDPQFGLRLILGGLAALGGWLALRDGSRLLARSILALVLNDTNDLLDRGLPCLDFVPAIRAQWH